MDLFGFGPKFGQYNYAKLPSYKGIIEADWLDALICSGLD